MRIAILTLLVLSAVPAHAGLFDYFRLPTSQKEVEPAVADARVKQYLEDLLGIKKFTIKGGHGPLTAAETKALDAHITSRMTRAPSMVTARIEAEGLTGTCVIAGPDVASPGWDPTKGFLAYVQLDTALVFPSEADRAYSLAAHVLGEQALFGFAPEAGPMWKVTERYLQQNAAAGGGPMGGGMGQLNAGDPIPYAVQSGESAPAADDIPAWAVRGLHDLKWKGAKKPVEMGLLIALTRRPASTVVRLTHVAGIGPLGKALFKDAHRLHTDDE